MGAVGSPCATSRNFCKNRLWVFLLNLAIVAGFLLGGATGFGPTGATVADSTALFSGSPAAVGLGIAATAGQATAVLARSLLGVASTLLVLQCSTSRVLATCSTTLRYYQVVSPVQLHAADAHLACIKSSADFGVLYKYFGVLYRYRSCLPVVQPFGCRMHT